MVKGEAVGHVVVTGASTGIGRTTALHLDSLGMTVHAGVRKRADADELATVGSERLRPLKIDVTEPDEIAAAAEQVRATCGSEGLRGLVNNAGVAVPGPIEFIPMADFRNQIEVNLIGQVAVTQAFMPLLRAGAGRVVNITSIGGRIAFPFMGAYHAAKFGLEATSDALRRELQPWGIHVAVIEPGSVATAIWERGEATADRVRGEMPPPAEDFYGETLDRYAGVLKKTAERGVDPAEVAKAVEHAITSSRPKTRYLVGTDAKIQARVAKYLPDRWFDRLVARSI